MKSEQALTLNSTNSAFHWAEAGPIAEEMPVKLQIVSASPIFARAVQRLLEEGPRLCRSEILPAAEIAGPSRRGDTDLVLVAPQRWDQFTEWLPVLQEAHAGRPWLLLADLRLAGMFLADLEAQPFTLVTPDSPPEQLWKALQAVAERRFCSLRAELSARFARVAHPGPNRRPGLPSGVELQCGCAVSLGLSNQQIADFLQRGEATVKSHLHHLQRKLQLKNRAELAACVQRVLAAPLPSLEARAALHYAA